MELSGEQGKQASKWITPILSTPNQHELTLGKHREKATTWGEGGFPEEVTFERQKSGKKGRMEERAEDLASEDLWTRLHWDPSPSPPLSIELLRLRRKSQPQRGFLCFKMELQTSTKALCGEGYDGSY